MERRRDGDSDRTMEQETSSRSRSPARDKERKHSSKDKHKRRDRSQEPDDRDRRSKHRRSKHDDDKHRDRDDRRRDHKDNKRESRKSRPQGLEIVDDDDDGDVWVEKDIDPTHATSNIPTALSLPLTSNPSNPPPKVPLPPTTVAGSKVSDREDWMLDPTEHASVTIPTDRDRPPGGLTEGYGDEAGARTLGGGVDFFSDLGIEKKKKDPNENKPDPSKIQIYRNELNTQLKEGKSVDEYVATERKVVPGGPGHQWRMMKLRRLYEEVDEQNRSVEEVAMERYGNMEDFQDALDERRILDEREQRRNARRGGSGPGTDGSAPGSSGMRTPEASGARRFVFNNTGADDPFSSRPNSRAGFRRPGDESNAGTPSGRVEELKRTLSSSSAAGGATTPQGAGRPRQFESKPQTPIPSVFAPRSAAPAAAPAAEAKPDPTSSTPVLTIGQLNQLQAQVLRAKLMDDPNAENLEAEYELERSRAENGGGGDGGNGLWAGGPGGLQGQMGRENADGRRVEVQMLPTLDGHGKLYDVGLGQGGDDGRVLPGNRRKKPEKFETRDRTGQLLRINADDDTTTLGDLVRQERFGAGAQDQKDMDYEMATAIAKDGKYVDNLDYMDENAERLARKKMKTDAMKRQFAINDYARTKKALDTCPFCYQDDAPPKAAIVALGARTYLACTQTEELVEGHCLIVPLQHHLSTLEMEDDDWEEVKNFMKCLMRMFAKENKGVIFFETCLSFKQQKHTYIEAIPLPVNEYNDAPAYFREAILASETEWSQHKKLIDFSSRPGGFRRAMVSNLPYFMVQFDYRGERGYGHVIEGLGDAPGKGVGENDDGAVGEGDNGGGEFPRYFAAEIIGNMLSVEPRRWRRPQKLDYALNKTRASKLGNMFQPYNWTLELQQS